MNRELLLQLLANSILSSDAINSNGDPMIDIQSEMTGPVQPQWMDYDGNISFSDTSRGMSENGPLVDWQTHNIADLGDENTPELAKLYQKLRRK